MGDIPLLLLTVPLSALATAGLSNAYNMIDGIDGLAASTITLPLLVLYLLALQADHAMANSILLMLVPLGVFLLFNLGPNNRLLPKVFLGDAGSVTMGFLVTASLVYFSQGDNGLILPVTALWLVAVPLMDMLSTIILTGYAALCAVTGLLLEGIPEYLSLLCYCLLFCGHCLFAVRSNVLQKKSQ